MNRYPVLTENGPLVVIAPDELVQRVDGYWSVLGLEGPQGPSGATGPQGVAGTQGTQGIAGPAGSQGSLTPTIQILAVQPVITRYQQRPATSSQRTTPPVAQQILSLQAERDALLITIRRSAGRTQDKQQLLMQVESRYGNQIAALLSGATGRTTTGAVRVTKSGRGWQ